MPNQTIEEDLFLEGSSSKDLRPESPAPPSHSILDTSIGQALKAHLSKYPDTFKEGAD